MTVIAFTQGELASDSLLSDEDGNKWGGCEKVRKVKGWLIGGAGDFDATEAFLAKFDPVNIEKKIFLPLYPGAPHEGEEFNSIIISPTGKIYEMSSCGIFGPIKSYGYYAIGCGMQVAMGAMAVGANARAAVKAAIRHSTGCGGRIQSVKL